MDLRVMPGILHTSHVFTTGAVSYPTKDITFGSSPEFQLLQYIFQTFRNTYKGTK